jgi:hypothetical protein
MKWAGHVARIEEMNAYRGLVGKPEGRTPLGRPRHTWEDIMSYRPIARQRLGKHIPAVANARNNMTCIARQRISKHA